MKSPRIPDRYFTNRENHFVTFENSINCLKDKKYSVLNFYGIGGIGKTRLKEELIKSVANKKNIIVSRTLDFHYANHRELSTALEFLYQDLKKAGINFPTFEIAHAIYWQKRNPMQAISKSNLPYIEHGSIVFEILSITEEIPLVGLIPRISTIVYKIKKGFDRWWIKNGERELAGIQQLEPHQIEEYLPYYFALDLKDHLELHSKDIIFFIDTYESLWETVDDRKKEKFFAKDRWVRKLIEYLPQTLWVIMGRERLKWDEIEENVDWKFALDQHLLGELGTEDANKFLEHCSIKEENIRNQIILTSKGLPFYLNLQVDTYNRIIESGDVPSVDNFGINYVDILERFSKYLSTNETETLKILSCTNFWDRTIFKKIIKEFDTGYPLTAFRELLNFSFITEVKIESEEKAYTIHEIMRAHLKANLDEDIRKEVHHLLLDHYEGLLNAESPELLNLESKKIIELTPKIVRFLDEIIYHKKKIEKTVIYYQWLLDISEKLYGKINSTSVQDALQKAKNDLVFSDNYLLLIRINYEIARLYSWKNDDLDTLNFFIEEGLNQIYNVIKEKYDDSDEEVVKIEPELIRLKTDFLLLKAEILQDLGDKKSAYELFLEAISLSKKNHYPFYSINYIRLLKDLGRIPEAEGFIYKELHNSIIDNSLENQAFYYNEIGKLFATQKLENIAKVYFSKSLNIYEEIKGKEHNYCWIIRSNYAICLINSAEAEQALILLNDVLKWWKSNYGESNHELGRIYHSLAECEFVLHNYTSAINYCLKARSVVIPVLGTTNTKVVESELLFCEIIQYLNKNAGLHIGVLSEDELTLYQNYYDNFIKKYEYIFYNNYKNYLTNSGYDSEVIRSLFRVIGHYYDYTNNLAKRTILDRRKNETNRVYNEQFKIREFEEKEKIKIEGENKKELLNRFEKELGIIKEVPVDIYKSTLPYFKNTYVYHLYYSDTVVKYILGNEDFVNYLDFSNAPIYGIAEKNGFILSPNLAIDYVYFFFDAIKGRHGKFYFPKNNHDLPLLIDTEISDEVIQTIQSNIQQTKLLEVNQDYILLEGNCFFKDALFKVKIEINSNGYIVLSDEDIVLEELPIALEPQFDQDTINNEEKIKQIILYLESRFEFTPIDDVDVETYDQLFQNIQIVKENFDSLNIQESNIAEIFDDALYLMEKYIKPMYENELVYRKEVGETLDEMKSILQESELNKQRQLIEINPRVLRKYNSLLSKKEQEKIQTKLLNHSIINEYPTDIYINYLSFYPNTLVYTLVMANGKPKYLLSLAEMMFLLDSTNRPIYTFSNKDFVLSTATVEEYVIFFFDSVIGTHGQFYIPMSKEDIPFTEMTNITPYVQNLLKELIIPLEIISVEKDNITLLGSIFFKYSLFQSKIKVDSKGVCQMFDEELIMENIPIEIK